VLLEVVELLWQIKESQLAMLKPKNKNKVKKVIKGLNKASKLHAGQAKTLKSIIGKKNGKKRS